MRLGKRPLEKWLLGLGGSIYALYYEYLWSRFALHNLGTISFGGWFGTSLAIATPWLLAFGGPSLSTERVRDGSVSREFLLKVSVLGESVGLCAYMKLAPEIHGW